MKHNPKTTYLVALVVACNSEIQAGLLQTAVWEREFPNQPEFGPKISVASKHERDTVSIERTKRLLSRLSLEVMGQQGIFVARETRDSHQRLRVVVCALVQSLAPLKKRFMPLVRVRFPVQDTQQTREEIIDELLSF